ncbi:MAG: hypothetical protein IT373_19235 [Polyangiaceae bacterium]|nr:hypothetical protein [Polyangiaceae bacterium]
MKIAKLIVLIAGLAGIAGFFVPVVAVDHGTIHAELSAFQLVEGMDAIQAAAGVARGRNELPPEAREAVVSIDENLARYRSAILGFFAPALLLVALAVLGAFTRFGRVLGLLAMLVGLAAAAGWGLLAHAATTDEVARTAQKYGARAGIAVWVMIGSGALGLLGGLFALVKPEPRRRAD